MSENAVAIPEKTQAIIDISQGGGLLPRNFEGLWRLSTIMAASGAMPKDCQSVESVFVRIQHGLEVGLSPMQAVQSIASINGRPAIWGDAVLGLVEASGLLEIMSEYFENEAADYPDDMTAVCYVKRKSGREVTQKFSVADAKRADLWTKSGPWKQYSRRMLQMRARGFALRDLFPDVLKGLVTVEEARDYDRDLVPVNGTYQTAPQPAALPTGDQSDLYKPKKLPEGNCDHVAQANEMAEAASNRVEKPEAAPEPKPETVSERFYRIALEKSLDMEAVSSYLAHCAKQSGKTEAQVISRAVDAVDSFIDAMGKWVETQKQIEADAAPKPTWDEQFRAQWVNLRKPGFVDFVHKRAGDFRRASDDSKIEAFAKWQSFYPDVDPPKCITVEQLKEKPAEEGEDLNQYPEYKEYMDAEQIDPGMASAAKNKVFGQNREPKNKTELDEVLKAFNAMLDEINEIVF